MENILTVAGCSQLMLALWGTDRIATVPALILGIIIFIVLVRAIRQVLKERQAPAAKRGAPVRNIARILYR